MGLEKKIFGHGRTRNNTEKELKKKDIFGFGQIRESN